MSARLLVIGGSYFVGRGIVDGLVAAGHAVTVLNRGSRPVPGTTAAIADRNDPQALRQAIGTQDFDCIIDCCCYDATQASSAHQALGDRAPAWIQLSSAAVYREDAPSPFREAGPLGRSAQWGAYGWDKLAAEHALEAAATQSARTVTSIRAPYVYGPGPNPSREPWLWARLLRGRPILIPGDGQTAIQFVYTADLARAVAAVVSGVTATGFHVFNVAEARAYSIADYVHALARAAGVSADLRRVDYQTLAIAPRSFFPFRDTPLVLDVSRIQTELDFRANRSLADGLAQTFASYATNELSQLDLDTSAEDRILDQLKGAR